MSSKKPTLSEEKVRKYGAPPKDISNSEAQNIALEKARLSVAIKKLDGRDKIGLFSETSSTVGGAWVGATAAGKIAASVGASKLLGSTILAKALGSFFIVTTPIGWTIAGVVAGAILLKFWNKAIASGAKQDTIRQQIIERLNNRLQALRISNNKNDLSTELQLLIALASTSNLLSKDDCKRIADLIAEGSLPLDVAIDRLRGLLDEAGLVNVNEDENFINKSAAS